MGENCNVLPGITIFNEDNQNVMSSLADESVDVICIDPPYLYLKGQKLEKQFDEHKFFLECRRMLKNDGFIVVFGRGKSFYRWNNILSDLEFVFKEEIIWDKIRTSSPVNVISRRHETIAIYSKKSTSALNKVYLPYAYVKQHDVKSIKQDLSRIMSALNNPRSLWQLNHFLETGEVIFDSKKTLKNKITAGGTVKERDRAVGTLKTIVGGTIESSIIREKREHYGTIHPTQKPVKLIERLLALVVKNKEAVVADFFAGSMSCMEAVYNLGLKGIGVEIDDEYFENGKKRLLSLVPQLRKSV